MTQRFSVVTRGAKVNAPHHGDNPLLKPTGIQTAIKFCEVQPTENIGNFYRQDDVFGYELKLLLSELLQDFQNLNYKLQRRLSDVMMIGL